MKRMPTMPVLLRSSGPSQADVVMRCLRSNLRRLPINTLADVLGCTRDTAKRRRRGYGWRLHEMFPVADALEMSVAELLLTEYTGPTVTERSYRNPAGILTRSPSGG